MTNATFKNLIAVQLSKLKKTASQNRPPPQPCTWTKEAATPRSEVELAGHVFGLGLLEVDERKAKELVNAGQGFGHARDVAGGVREDLEVQHCGQGMGGSGVRE